MERTKKKGEMKKEIMKEDCRRERIYMVGKKITKNERIVNKSKHITL